MSYFQCKQDTLLDLLDVADRAGVTWYLVFIEAEAPYWWTRFFKPGFRHVYALRHDGQHWIMLQPRLDFIDIEVLPLPSYLTIQEITDSPNVIKVTAWRRPGRMRHPWIAGPVTCVEVIKGILGIRAFFLWTPWQLFKYCRSGELHRG